MRGSIAARPAPPAETFSGTNRSERRKCEILLTLPIRNTTISRSQTWGHSSAGRAPAWHAGGRRFDPAWLHHNLSVDQRPIDRMMQVSASPSSRGLGHHPFTVDTGVRIPVGTPLYKQTGSSRELPVLLCAIGMPARAPRHIRASTYTRRMRSSALVLLHLLLAVLLAFDGMGAAFAAAGPAPAMAHAAHSASETPPPCHSSDADAPVAEEKKSPAPDSCCDGGDCLCLHGCSSVLPVVPRIAASTGGTVVVAHVLEDRVAPRLDDPVRPPILRP